MFVIQQGGGLCEKQTRLQFCPSGLFIISEIKSALKVASVLATESCFISPSSVLYNQLEHRGMPCPTEAISFHFKSFLSYFPSEGIKKKKASREEIKFETCYVVARRKFGAFKEKSG